MSPRHLLDALPLRRKLIAIIFLACATVSIMAAGLFLAHHLYSLRANIANNADLIARTVASYSAADLAFRDKTAAATTLSGLSSVPNIDNAFLYDENGLLFASLRDTPVAPVLALYGPTALTEYRDDFLHVREPVRFKDKYYGTLYLLVSLQALRDGVHEGLLALTGLLAFSVLLSLALAIRLQGRVSRPILALASAAQRVAHDNDYSVRVTPTSRDEIGTLGQVFNVMLERIAHNEAALSSTNRALRAVVESTKAMIHATGEQQLLLDVCRLIVECAGYRMAWVGWAEQDAQHSVLPVAHFGVEDGYLHTALITWADRPRGQGPTGTAIRTGQPVLARDILTEPDFGPWREAAQQRGYASSFAIPLKVDGATLGALSIYADKPDAFDGSEMELLTGLAQDLSFGVSALRTRQQRNEALNRLTQRTAEFEAMFKAIPDAVMFADVQRRIVLNNPSVHRMFGYSDRELLGNTTEMLYADPQDFIAQGKARFRAGNEASHQPYEMRYKKRDGTVFWTETLGAQVKDAHGTHIGFIGIFRDITERKRAETDLRSKERAIAASINGMAFSDLHGVITYANEAFVSMWGYRRADEVVGLTIPDLLQNPDDAAPVLQQLSQQGGWNGELVARRTNGSAFYILVSATLIRDAAGQPSQLMASFLDITARKHAEDTIRALNAELEQRVRDRTAELETANRELESFSYSVSHDLRAPLRSIDGFALILTEDYQAQMDDSARSHLARIRKASQHMGVLIDDMLKLSRMSRAEMRRQKTDLSGLAREIVTELERAEPERRVTVTITPSLQAECDTELLRVVLQNLLSNAWKYSRRTAQAQIEFGETAYEGARCLFVRDNGAGFDMQYAKKLFTPFQRLHSAKDFEGIGVGLATVARIVHRHHGRIWAQAEIGHGATFYFTLGDGSDAPGSSVT
jgi:PAS domain S-box-containing protein